MRHTTGTVRAASWSGRIVGVGLASALFLSACSGPAIQADGDNPPVAESSSNQEAASSPSPTESASAEESASPEAKTVKKDKSSKKDKPAIKAAAMLDQGSSGDKVRELQSRLKQIGWFVPAISPNYGNTTANAVSNFQNKRGIKRTGEVDKATWNALTKMTRKPSSDEMYNRIKAGKAMWKQGSSGTKVREIQARLKQVGWFSGNVTENYGSQTVSSVKGFQGKRNIPTTGEVDKRTWGRLVAMTRTPSKNELANKSSNSRSTSAAGLDKRCMSGRAICISKRTNTLAWVVNGKVQSRMDVRFGSDELPTREGTFSVGWKSKNHVSTLYNTSMPYAMFFSGGQAVHYSPDFAANGYNGASHGCVNVRNKPAVQSLFAQARVGDKVIVYR